MLMHTHEARLDALRKELARQGLDGFVIPISDEHMSEYVGGYAQRLAWLTGFGGSAGTAVVLKDRAAMFVDGRYTLQVREQVDGRLYDYVSVPQTSVAKWLGEHSPEGSTIGYDAWLHGKPWVGAVEKALAEKGAKLVPVSANPIDAVWDDRPAPSDAPAAIHPNEHAGKSSQEKRADIAEWLAERKLDAVVVAALEIGLGHRAAHPVRQRGRSPRLDPDPDGLGVAAHPGLELGATWSQALLHDAAPGDDGALQAGQQRRRLRRVAAGPEIDQGQGRTIGQAADERQQAFRGRRRASGGAHRLPQHGEVGAEHPDGSRLQGRASDGRLVRRPGRHDLHPVVGPDALREGAEHLVEAEAVVAVGQQERNAHVAPPAAHAARRRATSSSTSTPSTSASSASRA